MQNIKLFVSDVDGTLTDGNVYYHSDGNTSKMFSVKDGMGFKLLKENGIITCWLTSSSENLIRERSRWLMIDHLMMGVEDKLTTLKQLCDRLKITLNEVAYIGDDINDLEVMKEVGISFAPSDSHESILKIATKVVSKNGGHGAVREAIDYIISS
jgi:YrbI family 3-deoxy-D-manno-octulosonate 8-phosphate phosphatase